MGIFLTWNAGGRTGKDRAADVAYIRAALHDLSGVVKVALLPCLTDAIHHVLGEFVFAWFLFRHRVFTACVRGLPLCDWRKTRFCEFQFLDAMQAAVRLLSGFDHRILPPTFPAPPNQDVATA